MTRFDTLATDALAALEQDFAAQHARFRGANLTLDLTRGKPAAAQLELANSLDGILDGDYLAADGTDTRNYGGILGIPEARALGAELLGVRPAQVMAGDNSSLTLMYQYLDFANHFGVAGSASAWRSEAEAAGRPVRFLCPVPGYDRHFAICERFGIDMQTVPLTGHGPDMDQVEALVAADPLIKGIWCVPKYSNPTGETYDAETVRRIAELPKRAGANFRVMWDNAYAVHDLTDQPAPLADLMQFAEAAGIADAMFMTSSTSKITHAGSGIAFAATSEASLAAFEQHLSIAMIGPDKVNQLRHARLLRDAAGIRAHMARLRELLAPKFELAEQILQDQLGDCGIASWSRPTGGYFISFDTLPGLASEVIGLAAEAGVKLTPAGSVFPYRRDPQDKNIRLAPSFPPLDALEQALKVFVNCVKLASARKLAASA